MVPCFSFFKGKLYPPLSPNENNLAHRYRPAGPPFRTRADRWPKTLAKLRMACEKRKTPELWRLGSKLEHKQENGRTTNEGHIS